MDLFNMSFPQALEKVRSDFNITQVERHSIGKPSTTVITSTPSKASTVRMQVEKTILVKYRDWLLIDKEFWNGQYHISRETLQKFGVSPISDYWINGTYFVASQLSYLYYYFISEDDRHIVKIYQPRNRNLKWISNSGHLQVIQGEGMLPKTGDLLIITKSLKDIMVLYEMGYTAIAPQSENTIINGAYFEKQKQRFKRIVLFYDNDAAGRTASKFFAEQHNLSTIFIPSYYYSHYKIKDISDYVKYFSFLKGRGLLNYLLNE